MNWKNLDKFGFRLGSLRSQAVQLYYNGATAYEVSELLGSAYLTVLAEAKAKGYKVSKSRVRVGKNRPHFMYKIHDKEG